MISFSRFRICITRVTSEYNDLFVEGAALLQKPVLRIIVQEKCYQIVRDTVHSTISSMFEEGRKIRNLLLIQEHHSSTEIAREIDSHNQNSSILSYYKLMSVIFGEVPKMGMHYSLGIRRSKQLLFDSEKLLRFYEYRYMEQNVSIDDISFT